MSEQQAAFVVMGARIWPAEVVYRNDHEIQVRTDAARLVSPVWPTLVFKTSGEALVGTARLVLADGAEAQRLATESLRNGQRQQDADEDVIDEMYARLCEAVDGKRPVIDRRQREFAME